MVLEPINLYKLSYMGFLPIDFIETECAFFSVKRNSYYGRISNTFSRDHFYGSFEQAKSDDIRLMARGDTITVHSCPLLVIIGRDLKLGLSPGIVSGHKLKRYLGEISVHPIDKFWSLITHTELITFSVSDIPPNPSKFNPKSCIINSWTDIENPEPYGEFQLFSKELIALLRNKSANIPE